MHVERQYRELEKIEEIKVYNVNTLDFYQEAPRVMKPDKVRFSNIMKHVPTDIDVFLPVNEGEDFIIERVGWNILQRANINLEDVEYRLLSQCSPFFYDILIDDLREVYKTGETKALRIFYYISDRVKTLANVHILRDGEEVYLISDFKETKLEPDISAEEQKKQDNENKASLIEYFSQTGSYYKSRDEYVWTPGTLMKTLLEFQHQEAILNIWTHTYIPNLMKMVKK